MIIIIIVKDDTVRNKISAEKRRLDICRKTQTKYLQENADWLLAENADRSMLSTPTAIINKHCLCIQQKTADRLVSEKADNLCTFANYCLILVKFS